MLISVIIPTCNRNDLLAQCLERIVDGANAGFIDYEIIVTDDSNQHIAQELIEQRFNSVRCVKGPQTGPAANRNNGAKHAFGEWLVFFDDDCLPDTEILYSYSKLIQNSRDTDVVEGLIYSDNVIPQLFTAPVNLTGGHLWSCNFGIKKTVFDKLNGFDENYKYPNLEDNDLNKRIIQAGYKIIFGENAKVYHAPRPVASPQKFAKYHESWLYYHKKFGEDKTVTDLLKTITVNRLRSIIKSPKSTVSIKAFYNLIAELFFTVRNSRHWDKSKIN